jgi:exodeoxyribonuclease-3
VRIATWNINSIRARVDRAVSFLERADVDVLALQETKCKAEQFPFAEFEAATS